MEGCRNDANSNQTVVELVGDVDDMETGDAPDSSNHDGVAMSNQTGGARDSASYPTVVETGTGGGTPAGMCHAINSRGLVLGAAVSSEADADRPTDQDGPTNLDPAADATNRDSDDGLTFPAYWVDGTPTFITYTVSAPAIAVAGYRYLNIWVDWNRDGDWGDSAVSCAFGTRDEHLLMNRPVNLPNDVAPGSTATFRLSVNSCNPVVQDRAWVRITLSDEPIPGQSYRDDLVASVYYYGSNGTLDWTSQPWTEISDDDNPAAGDVRIATDLGDNSIRIGGPNNGIWRQANLSGYTWATLSFEYRRHSLDNANDYVEVWVSGDGGSNWTQLGRFAGPATDAAYQSASYDISGYMASNTRIRFLSSSSLGTRDYLYVDNVRIVTAAVLANDDGRGPDYCFTEGETEDYLYDPTLEFGDAPDSTNNESHSMAAYGGGVLGNFPTTINPALGGPVGMCHILRQGTTPFLGRSVTAENTDADRLADSDPLYNILPLTDQPNNDGGDDAIPSRLILPHCQAIQVPFTATVPVATGAFYVNMWVDWNRDGDWGDPGTHAPDQVVCPGGPLSEWAAQNLLIPAGTTGVYHGVATITSYNPTGSTQVWMRVTLTRQQVGAADGPRQDGSGPGMCVDGGETEDHFRDYGPTAVKLISLAAAAHGKAIQVTWETASEVDNAGFNLYRREAGREAYARVNGGLIPAQAPGQEQGAYYAYLDPDVTPGVAYEYLLEDVDLNGTPTSHGPVVATAPYFIFLPLLER